MTSYPTALAPQLNQVPEDAVAGHVTPSHGGLISGHEFDMTISPPHPQYQSQASSPSHTTALPAPLPRGSTPNSHRQRPVSMPPQTFLLAGTANPAPTSETRERSHDENKERRRHRDDTTRSSRSNRILGDYTLSKTLGAGSMGKVKLATHNITGEKVRVMMDEGGSLQTHIYPSWRSKFFLGYTPIHPHRQTVPALTTIR